MCHELKFVCSYDDIVGTMPNKWKNCTAFSSHNVIYTIIFNSHTIITHRQRNVRKMVNDNKKRKYFVNETFKLFSGVCVSVCARVGVLVLNMCFVFLRHVLLFCHIIIVASSVPHTICVSCRVHLG